MTSDCPTLPIMELLRTDGDVAGIVTPDGGYPQVYPETAPPRAKPPYLLVSLISNEDDSHHMGGPGTLYRATVQVDGYADDYLVVRSLATATRNALHGLPNPTRVVLSDGFVAQIEYCALTAERSETLPPIDGSGNPLRRFSHDYRVAYRARQPKH